MVNNWLYIAEPDVAAPALQYEPHIIRTMDMDEGTALYTVSDMFLHILSLSSCFSCLYMVDLPETVICSV